MSYRNLLKGSAFALALFVGAIQFSSLAEAQVAVSSKIDTEGGVLGNIILTVLNANGIKTTDRIQLGATPVVRKAITAGEIDIYPEYTGNAAFFFNKADDPLWKDPAKAYETAKKLDYDANKIVWLTPSPPTTHGASRCARMWPMKTSSQASAISANILQAAARWFWRHPPNS